MATETEQDKIYRLEDIEVQEVSVVDRAANKRKFLVVKSEERRMAKSIGAEIKPDGKGGHTVVKDEPQAAPAQGEQAAATPPAIPAPEGTQTPAGEPKLKLSAEARAEMLKRVEGATAKLAALKAMLDSAEEVAGSTEIPNEIVLAVGDVLHLLSEGEAEKSDGVKIDKGRKQISTVREAKLRAAHTAIGDILSELEAVTPPVEPPADGATPAPGAEDALAKSFRSLEERLAKALSGILDHVKKQGEAVSKQAERIEQIDTSRGRVAGNGARVAEEVTKNDAHDQRDWPMDMNRPGHGDAGPGLRFGGSRAR